MRYGASTFVWTSPFSNRTLDLFDRVKAIGFDILEICVEDPATIDVPAIRDRSVPLMPSRIVAKQTRRAGGGVHWPRDEWASQLIGEIDAALDIG